MKQRISGSLVSPPASKSARASTVASRNSLQSVHALEPAEALRHEHDATLEGIQRAQARALHQGEMLLQARQDLGKDEWDYCLSTVARYRQERPGDTRLRRSG